MILYYDFCTKNQFLSEYDCSFDILLIGGSVAEDLLEPCIIPGSALGGRPGAPAIPVCPVPVGDISCKKLICRKLRKENGEHIFV